MPHSYFKWFMSSFHFLDFDNHITCFCKTPIKQELCSNGIAKKKLFSTREYIILTVFEENILRISLVLLLNICGMTKFRRDINSNRLF